MSHSSWYCYKYNIIFDLFLLLAVINCGLSSNQKHDKNQITTFERFHMEDGTKLEFCCWITLTYYTES
jgi:hypothetical protein